MNALVTFTRGYFNPKNPLLSKPKYDSVCLALNTGNYPSQSKNLLKKFISRTASVIALLLFFGGSVWGQISLPYTELFTGITVENGFPTVTGGAWTRSGTTTNQPTYIANQSSYNRSGNNDTKFITFRYNSGTRSYFVGPFALTAGVTYQSSVLYKADGATGFGPLALTYGTTAAEATQTNTIASVAANIVNTTFSTLSGTFSPATSGNYFLAIRSTQNGNPWYLTCDDFTLSVAPSCLSNPSLLLSSVTTATSATLSWTAASPAPASGYEIYYSTTSTAPGAGTAATTSTGAGVVTKSVTGLTANSTYYWWVRSACNAIDKGAWVNGGTFSTLDGLNCALAQDLSLLTSPYSGTTVGYPNSFTSTVSSCLTGTGGDRIFKINVPNGDQLFIGQSVNNYDSRHRIAYGGACPGTTEINTGYVGNFPTQTTTGTILGCLDDDDYTHYYFKNTTGSTQTVYWIQDGHSTGQGTFTLEWQLSTPPPPTITTVVSLSSFSTCSGFSSTAQSFSVSGANMTAGITVTPPAGFEVSTSATFASGIGTNSSPLVVGAAGTIASTTIHVRLASTATGSPSGNITLTSSGATAQNVAVTGTVNTTPTPTGTIANDAEPCGNVTLTYSSPDAAIYWQTSATGTSTSLPTTDSYILTSSGTIYARGYNSATGCWSSGTVNSGAVTVTPQSAPTISIAASISGTICSGTSITFTPTITNGGSAPAYEWFVNGSPVGTSTTYTSSSFLNGDQVYCVLTSNSPCAPVGNNVATSNTSTLSISNYPTTQATLNSYTNNDTGNSLTVNWTRGNGATGVIVVARLSTTTAVDPTSGTTYTANASFGAGTGNALTGSGNFVVYVGTGTNVALTGLTGNTAYTLTVYEYTNSCYFIPGASSAVTTPLQNALSFDGSNDKVNCGTAPSIDITGSAITLEAWIYPTSWRTNAFEGSIINKESNNSGYMLRCGANGTLSFNFGNGASSPWVELSSSAGALTLNTWQHVAGTYDGTTLRLYRNGVLLTSSNSTASIASATSSYQLTIGNWSQDNTRGFIGLIDEVRIWSVARSASELVSGMTQTPAPCSSGLRASYSFNQGTAGGTNTTVTTLTDATTNGNNGTLSGFALSGTSSNWVIGKSGVTDQILAACTGTPAPGNTTASSTSVVSGTVVALGLQNSICASGVTYQWQSSTTSSTAGFSDISGATSAAYSPTVTSSAWYRCNVTCSGNTGTSTAVQVSLVYCTPAPSSVDGAGITNVSFGVGTTVNNTTVAETGNYGNYTNLIGGVIKGTTLPVNITYSTGYTYDTKIWVDWNNNFSFLDSGEEMYVGTSTSTNPTTLAASIAVLSTIPGGDYRMRIGGQDSGPATPCYTGTYGAFEDYTLRVLAPSISASGSLSAFTTCSASASTSQSFTVSGTSLGADLVVTAPTGFEVSTSQAGTYSTSVSYTPTSGSLSSQTVWVRMTATATGSPSGNIAVSSTGGTTQNIAVSGTVNATPTAVTVTGGAICNGETITASGGTGGTIYWQGTSSNGTSTSTGSGTTSPALSSAGTYYARSRSAEGCWGSEGSAVVTITPIPGCIAAGFAPSDANTNINPTVGTTITWSAVTDATSYDVYFGTDNSPSNIVNGVNQSGTTYTTGALSENTTYYWKIVPKNACGAASSCSVYSFTTTGSCTAPTISSTDLVDINCFGESTGSITINATGGISGYEYTKDNGVNWQLSNVFSGLYSGSYSIGVKGGDGCTGLISVVTLSQPTAPLVVTASGGGSGCEGSTLSLASSVSGGTSPYSYSWSNASGLSSGSVANPTATIGSFTSHTLTVTDNNGCIATSSTVSITNNSPAAPTVTTPAAICLGQSANLVANSSGNGILWYTQSTGGSAVSPLNLSGANYAVSPTSSTTYYAEAVLTSTGTQTFNYTGANQTWTVPAGVTEITISAWGAEGGGSLISGNTNSGEGGKGGYSNGKLTVTPGQTLNFFVGGFGASSTSGLAAGGWNGGGSGYASSAFEPGNGGGGASDVRVGGTDLSNRVIVAGGGGGGGEDAGDSKGNGGGLTGTGYTGFDASQTAAGTNGQLGIGASTNFGDGGGGGGGYYGGGTLQSATVGDDTQGGGGGSGYIGGVTSASTIDGGLSMPNPNGGTMVGNAGNGIIKITYSIAGCASSRTPLTVTVNDAPTANAGTALSAICQGQTSAAMGGSISGTATSGTWSGGAGTWANANDPANATYTAGAAESGSVTLTLTPSGGSCPAIVTTKTIFVNSIPSAPTSPTNLTICQGGSGNISISGSLTGTQNVQFNITTEPSETNSAPGNTISTATISALPAGSLITSANLSVSNLTALVDSWKSDVYLGLSGAIAYNAVAGNTGSTSGTFNYSSTVTSGITLNTASNSVNLLYWDASNDNSGAECTFGVPKTANLTFNYSYPATINWYSSAVGGTLLGTGATFNPVGTSVLPNTNTPGVYNFYAESVNGQGCSSARVLVTVTVLAPSAAGTATADQTICTGGSPADLTLAGNLGTIQWQSSTTSSSTGFANIPSATNATLTPGALTAITYYRAVVTNGACASINSNAVTITVVADPVITNSSNSYTYCVASPVEISASSSGGTGTMNYRWQYNNAGTWGAVADNTPASVAYVYDQATQTNNVLSISNLPVGTYSYRFRQNVNSLGCAANGAAITLTIVAATSITTQPTTATQNGLSGATVSVTATGAGLTYQWYSNTTASNSNGTLISGATSSSYTPAPTSNTYYYCVVTGACGTVTSDVSGAVSGIPVTLLQSSQWNASIGASTAIVVNYVFGATHYKYKLVSSAGTEYVTLTRRWIYPHEIPNMLYGRTYTLSVSVSGNGTTFGAFGTEKDFTMVTTSLTTSSGAVSYGTPISASYLPYFTNYKFKVESVEDGVQYVEVPRRWMYPYEIPNMVYGRSYTISVAIQNSFNSSYSAYGQSNSIVCTTTAPSMETPSSTIGIWSPIIAAHMTGFTSYKYKLEPVGGGTTLYVEVPRRWFYPYEAAVTIGASYNVSVAVKNNIGTSAYSEYSASVAYTVSSATTSLQQYLCGTNVNSTTSLASYEVQDAQEYRYRLRNTSTNVVYVYYSTTNSMTIAAYDTYAQANNLPALPSGTYSVAVAYTLDTEIGPYSANGSLCEINYTAPQGLAIQDPQLHQEQTEGVQSEEQATNTDDNNTVKETTATLTETTPNSTWTATATSNPFAHSFQIKLNGVEGISIDASFTAQLTDMSGKVYSLAILSKEQLEAESFGEQLAPGMYLMTLRQGEELRVIRVVKR